MNRRVLLILLLLVVVGGGAILFLTQSGILGGQATPTAAPDANGIANATVVIPTPVNYVRVVIAVQELKRGAVVPESAVAVREWPLDTLPQYGLTDPKDVIGRIARVDIPLETPILSTQLVDQLGKIGQSGSDAALVIPQGLVAISVPIDRLGNVAHAVKDGDYVDVIVSFLFVDIDEEFQSKKPNNIAITTVGQDGTIQILQSINGRVEPSGDFNSPVIVSPVEEQRPRLATQFTVQRAFVIHVGTFPSNGDFLGRRPSPTPIPVTPDPNNPTPTIAAGPSPTPDVYNPDIITLAVQPQEALVVAYCVESGLPFYLTLRSIQSRDDVYTTTRVTLDYMTQTYGIDQPRKLPYALEPPIRSVRRLVLENVVSLSNPKAAAAAPAK